MVVLATVARPSVMPSGSGSRRDARGDVAAGARPVADDKLLPGGLENLLHHVARHDVDVRARGEFDDRANGLGRAIDRDGDTGYGNALNVQRTVVEYARAGAAAVMIEDQVSPKKCGHTRGKQVISREKARLKICAAVEARSDVDILIMARPPPRQP